MPSTAIYVASEFHGLVQVIRHKRTNFTGHSSKCDSITSAQFNVVFRLRLVGHASHTSGVGLQHDIVRGNPCTGDTQFNNEAFLHRGHPAAIEASTCAPVTFVHSAVAGFTHIETVILHRTCEASAELALREESAHTKGEGEILEVVFVVLDVEHTETTRYRETNGKARSVGLGHGVSLGLLASGFGSGDRVGDGLLTSGFFGSGDGIGASLFGSDRISNSLLASFFSSDRVGDGLLASGFHSGSAAFGVHILTKSINSARIHGRSFGYRLGSGSGRSGFGHRSGGSSRSSGRLSSGLSRGCRSRRSSSGSCGRLSSRSRCSGRLRCRCGRCLSIGATDHRGKEYNHCKFLHRFSIHKRVCIKFSGNI